jgi:hypothetical protein
MRSRLALEPVQNLEFWRCKRQNSTLQARKEPENRDFCGLLTAKIHNLNRLLDMLRLKVVNQTARAVCAFHSPSVVCEANRIAPALRERPAAKINVQTVSGP